MEGSDQLLTIAEIGSAFAGFTAIVGTLTASIRGRFVAKVAFWIMFEFSLATILFALLPFVLFNFAIAPQAVWGSCSVALALFLLVHILVAGGRFIQPAVARGEYSKYGPRMIVPFIALTAIIQILNASNVYFERSYAAYFLGLILFLILASANFVVLLLQVWSTEGIDPDGIDPDGIDPDGIDPDGVDPDGVDPDDAA